MFLGLLGWGGDSRASSVLTDQELVEQSIEYEAIDPGSETQPANIDSGPSRPSVPMCSNMMSRLRSRLPLVGAPVLQTVPGRKPTADGRPNVVVIMADDLDVETLETLLAGGHMPYLSQYVLDQGVKFVESFVTTSLCCPSRSSFLSGQYAHNHGVGDNSPGVTGFDDSSTLATWLQASGYRTGHLGKYLNMYGVLGNRKNDDPPECDTSSPSCEHYVPPGWNDWQGLLDPSTYRMYNYYINDNGAIAWNGWNEDDYQTDVLAERACEFVAEAEAYDDRPFLLVVTPLAPHIEVFNPLDVCSIRSAPRHADMFLTETLSDKPSRNEPDMSDKPWWTWDGRTFDLSPDQCMNRHYRSRLRSMLAVDDLIGVIGRSLEETGELENTVIVFTSDNGFLMAEHRIFGKFHAYEEAIRVPLAIRTPGRAARSESAIALNIDLAPTIADLAGITPYTEAASQRYCDGRSLRPLLEGRTPTQWRRRFLVENVSDNGDESEMIAHAAVRMGASENRFARHSLYTHYFQADPQAEEYYDNLDSVPDKYQEKSTHSALPALWRTALRWLAAKLRGCSNRPDQPFSCRQLEDL